MSSDSIVPKSFEEVLEGADNDSTRIQAFCQDQRIVSNRTWKARFLSDHFGGPQPDKILVRLLEDPNYEDPRNNLTIWARPGPAVTALAAYCQAQLQGLGLDIWLTPQNDLHMTVLVVAVQLSVDQLDSILPSLKAPLVRISKFYAHHQTRLVKPAISFSDSGVVLSYVPCAGDITDGNTVDHDYTFLHLQHDLFKLCHGYGIEMSAQKPPGSCYMTLGRFTQNANREKPDATSIASWLAGVEKINATIRTEYWPSEGSAPAAGNWIIGGKEGLDIRKGRSWYGGGQSLAF